MIAATLGTIAPITDIEDAQQAMSRNGAESLAVARALAEEGTFANAELINSQESDDFRHTSLSLNPGVLAGFLTVNANAGEAWSVSSQEELLDRGFPLFAKIKERAERLEHRGNMFLYRGDVRTLTIKIDRLERAYRRTLEAHPDWPIAQAVRGLNEIDHRALTILIGKDLNFADADDELFLGEGLARAVAGDVLVAVYRHFGIPRLRKPENVSAVVWPDVLVAAMDGTPTICRIMVWTSRPKKGDTPITLRTSGSEAAILIVRREITNIAVTEYPISARQGKR